jgi:hypothetical protein
MATVSSQRKKVKGVNFVVDEGNEKKAVIIDLKKHRAIWEDFYDTLLAKERGRSHAKRSKKSGTECLRDDRCHHTKSPSPGQHDESWRVCRVASPLAYSQVLKLWQRTRDQI